MGQRGSKSRDFQFQAWYKGGRFLEEIGKELMNRAASEF